MVRDSQRDLKKLSMSDCFYVPENSENLMSVSKITRKAKKLSLGKILVLSKKTGPLIF